MQSLPEFFFVLQSSDLVMSWHARCLPKWGRKCSLFFARTPPSLCLQTVQPPLLVCVLQPPSKN